MRERNGRPLHHTGLARRQRPGKVLFFAFCFETVQNSDQVPEKKPQLEAMAYDSSAASGQNEINYAHLFEEELLKVTSKEQVAIPYSHLQGTSKKKVLDQPNGMIVQAELNITMPGRLMCLVCLLPRDTSRVFPLFPLL